MIGHCILEWLYSWLITTLERGHSWYSATSLIQRYIIDTTRHHWYNATSFIQRDIIHTIIVTTRHHWYNATSLIQRYTIDTTQHCREDTSLYHWMTIEHTLKDLWFMWFITTTPTSCRFFSKVSSAVISYMKSNGEVVLEKIYLLLHISVPLLLHVQLLCVWVGWVMETDGGSEGGCISVFVSEFVGK